MESKELKDAIRNYLQALEEWEEVGKPLQDKLHEAKERLKGLLPDNEPIATDGKIITKQVSTKTRLHTTAIRKFIATHKGLETQWLTTYTTTTIKVEDDPNADVDIDWDALDDLLSDTNTKEDTSTT